MISYQNSLCLRHVPGLLELVVEEEVDGPLSVNQPLLQADHHLLLLLQRLLPTLLALPRQLELDLRLAARVVDVVVVDAHILLRLLHLLEGVLKHLNRKSVNYYNRLEKSLTRISMTLIFIIEHLLMAWQLGAYSRTIHMEVLTSRLIKKKDI